MSVFIYFVPGNGQNYSSIEMQSFILKLSGKLLSLRVYGSRLKRVTGGFNQPGSIFAKLTLKGYLFRNRAFSLPLVVKRDFHHHVGP